MFLWEIIIIVKRHLHVCLREVTTVVQDQFLALKYGLSYVPRLNDRKLTGGKNADSETYGATSYAHLEKIFASVVLSPDDVFVDIGCGRGRVTAFAALHRPKKVIGLEIVADFAAQARAAGKKVSARTGVPIEICQADAAVFCIADGTVYFMYHPFGPRTLQEVLDNIRKSLETHPRRVRIVYHNPIHDTAFADAGWLIKSQHLESVAVGHTAVISVWENDPAACAKKTTQPAVPLRQYTGIAAAPQ